MEATKKYLGILGLEPGASRQTIQDAYRELVKVWHPDRFEHDPRLKERASEQIKQINEAFEGLRDYNPADHRGRGFGDQHAESRARTAETPSRPLPAKGMVRKLLGGVWFATIATLWVIGIVHSFRHHGLAARFFSVVVPPFGVYQGVEGLIRRESGHLGISIDYGIKKMRERIEEEKKQEAALEILLSSNSDRLEYLPQDNSQAKGEGEAIDRESRARLQTYRATLSDQQEIDKVDQFLQLITDLEAVIQNESDLMDQLAKKFPRRSTDNSNQVKH